MDPLERAVERAARVRSVASAAEGERERCAVIAEKWTTSGHILLHAGEMTAQELRSVKAVAKAIAAEIRSS